jgi:preprotein translocase subunit SecD
MKRLLYIFISIAIAVTLATYGQPAYGTGKSITLQSTDKNLGPETLKQSADIISTRLKLFGISSFEVKLSADKGQINIQFPDNTDISNIEGLVTAKGDLAFFETYTQNEIGDLFKQDDPLLKFLHHDKDQSSADPRIGCAGIDDRKKVDDYLHTSAPVRNCKLFWGFDSDKSGYCLFALKTNGNGKALLGRSDIESVNIVTEKDGKENKIQIKLKPDAAPVFAVATKNNLNKAIAIVIDDKVYSWPIVKSAIESGEIEVTGSFTAKEAGYFPALFNSQELPQSFRLLK